MYLIDNKTNKREEVFVMINKLHMAMIELYKGDAKKNSTFL